MHHSSCAGLLRQNGTICFNIRCDFHKLFLHLHMQLQTLQQTYISLNVVLIKVLYSLILGLAFHSREGTTTVFGTGCIHLNKNS